MNNRPICSEKGCNNKAMKQRKYKGKQYYAKLCCTHHKRKHGMPNGSWDKKRIQFPNKQCTICLWDGPCDRHRIVFGKEGGQYKQGNVLILCPNCHRLLHMGRLFLK